MKATYEVLSESNPAEPSRLGRASHDSSSDNMSVLHADSASTTSERVPLLTPAEVATYLQVSEKTLANWRYLGRGPRFVKVGRDIRYRESDLEHWLTGMSSSAEA